MRFLWPGGLQQDFAKSHPGKKNNHPPVTWTFLQDVDAVVYLMLASELVKSMRPSAVMIAEDVSGMPGLCVPVAEGCIKGGRLRGKRFPPHWGWSLEGFKEFFSEDFSEAYAVCCWVQILVHLYSWKRMKKRSNVNFSYEFFPLSQLQGSWS